jgi:hypothetical protein
MPRQGAGKKMECKRLLKNIDATIAKMPRRSIEAKSYVNNILK